MSVKDEKEVQEEEAGEAEEVEEVIDDTVDCMDENLWLGNLAAATNLDVIDTKGVIRLLTVDIWPIPKKIYGDRDIKVMRVPVTDLPTENLISYFEDTYEFISNGVKEGPVLVHCYHGVSRSVAVVLAYLMKKYELSFENAFELAQTKKKLVEPNPGFLAQLKLYETMRFTIDKENMQYKMFRLYITADKMSTKTLPADYADVVQLDPAIGPLPPVDRIYRCGRCRRILVTGENIIPHFPREKFTWRDTRFSTGEDSEYYCDKLYFIEPMTWMRTVFDVVSGKLYCPNRRCRQKLGSFCWSMGCLCPCGSKVCPGFYLVPSRVDVEEVIRVDLCETLD